VFAKAWPINYKIDRGPAMGNFSSYFFFAAAAGLVAAAIVIALMSAVAHFREATASLKSSARMLGDAEAAPSEIASETSTTS
jgi:hypothetical protein